MPNLAKNTLLQWALGFWLRAIALVVLLFALALGYAVVTGQTNNFDQRTLQGFFSGCAAAMLVYFAYCLAIEIWRRRRR